MSSENNDRSEFQVEENDFEMDSQQQSSLQGAEATTPGQVSTVIVPNQFETVRSSSPTKDSKKSVSRASTMSIRSKMRKLKLDTEQALADLKSTFLEKKEDLELDLRSKRRKLEEVRNMLSQYPTDLSVLNQQQYEVYQNAVAMERSMQGDVISAEDALSTATRIYEMKKKSAMRSWEIQAEKLQIDQEELEEQALDSDEENKVRNWEGASARQNSPPPHHSQPTQHHPAMPHQTTHPTYRQPSPPDMQEKMVELMNAQLVLLQRQSTAPSYVDRELPQFNGRADEWNIFYNEYIRTHNSFKPSENLIRLRKALKGAAKDAVMGLLDDPNSIDDILTVLKNRFGRPEYIISALIKKVKEAKSPEVNKPGTMITFGTEVQNLVIRVKSMRQDGYLYDITLLKELTRKLPSIYAEQWVMWLQSNPDKHRNLSSFAEWIKIKVAVAEELHDPEINDQPKGEDKQRKIKPGVHAANEENEDDDTKAKKEVPILKKLSLDERWKVVKDMHLCYLCLKPNHALKDCSFKRKCDIDGCGKPHHRLLHRASNTDQPKSEKRKENKSQSSSRSNTPPPSAPPMDDLDNMSAAMCKSSLPVIPVWIHGPKGKKKVFALLDTGANFTMMEEEVAKEVGLQGEKTDLSFTVFGGKKKEVSTIIDFDIAGSSHKASSYSVKNARTVAKLGIPGVNLNVEELKKHHPHLLKLQAKSYRRAVPQVLLGFDCFHLFYPRLTLEPLNSDHPHAFKSKLGWYVLEKGSDKSCFLAYQSKDEELHAAVKDFFSTEAFGTTPILNSARSMEDKRALELLEKYTVKKGDRWESCLLWKADDIQLPESKMMATKRLKSMERKMDSNRQFSELVQIKFEDYIAKGYLVPKSQCEVNISEHRKWFLPWFFAYHPSKKPRLVFDAAAKSGGKSLNDFLLKGPDLLNPLPSVLTRFRTHQVAVTGYIKEMFHQVKLRKEDWPSQTILYRGTDRSKPPQEYYMTVLFFGSASSPCSAIFAKNKNAERFAEQYPEAVKAILHDFYMDDFLGGANSEEEAIRLRQEITEIHAAGGFQVVKWNSSSAKVLKSIPQEIRAEGELKLNSKDEVPLEKTLGLYWSPSDDKFMFKLNFHKVKEDISSGAAVPTKREMVSLIMSLFDPLGFLSPLKIKALILIQDVWRSKIGWDDEIPINVFSKWKEWICLLQQVNEVKVKRFFLPSTSTQNELHIFCDASEEAFASAVYLSTVTGGRRSAALVVGKARVAPLRGLTIPKMELQAALLGSRLSKSVLKSFGSEVKVHRIHFWSDSKSVLCQIRSSTLRYRAFEANRIGEILELTDVDQWKWVSTKDNVADDATRFSSDIEMSSSCRWLRGSQFIHEKEEKWPVEKVKQEDMPLEDMGVKVIAAAAMTAITPDITRFSNWYRLIRTVALLFRRIRKCKKVGPSHITNEDKHKAKLYLIRLSQMEAFPGEYKLLKKGEDIPKSSRLYLLSPTLSQDSVIILRGRIDAAPSLSTAAKNPPILSPKSYYTQLLIKWHHEQSQHFGQEKVVNDLRQEVWILDCRAAVRSVWANCMICKTRSAKPCQPLMGQLPAARLGEGRQAWYHTGIDLFGHLTVTIGRKTYKRWGALFTCMSTRAVHLELVDSLSTSDIIDALTRFINTRGRPSHIWSDNGTNFVGASRELKEVYEAVNQSELQDKMLVKGVEWHFIPPAAPFMGGAWESLIGVVKRILSHMMKEQSPKESTMRTFFTEIMEIMNNRPLTHVSTNPEDPDCITPNSLLRLNSSPSQTVPGSYEEGDKFRKSWRHGQHLADDFWRRWVKEYLPRLAKRNKWNNATTPLQVGDLVIVVDDQVPRSGWKKGIVTAVYPGKDKQVRVVDVRVAQVRVDDPQKKVTFSTYRRPSAKVIPLAINIV